LEAKGLNSLDPVNFISTNLNIDLHILMMLHNKYCNISITVFLGVFFKEILF
jgi:hypothetical protein